MTSKSFKPTTPKTAEYISPKFRDFKESSRFWVFFKKRKIAQQKFSPQFLEISNEKQSNHKVIQNSKCRVWMVVEFSASWASPKPFPNFNVVVYLHGQTLLSRFGL